MNGFTYQIGIKKGINRRLTAVYSSLPSKQVALRDAELCSLTDDGIEWRSGGVYKNGKFRVGAGVGDQCDGGKGR
jgi:hypothetical protein